MRSFAYFWYSYILPAQSLLRPRAPQGAPVSLKRARPCDPSGAKHCHIHIRGAALLRPVRFQPTHAGQPLACNPAHSAEVSH